MIVNNYVDAVVGLQYGDEGKGKITASLIEQKDYDFTVRYNGGPNAGHTICKQNGAEYSLHQLPSSIVYQKPGYIAPGCVLDIDKLIQEASDFILVEGFDPFEYLYISPQVPLIRPNHKKLDSAYHYSIQGSTNSGIAPAYANYHNRTSELFRDEETFMHRHKLMHSLYQADTLLLEGAQGFYLNPTAGNYPYTTSSNCSPASASANLGFSPTKLNNIIGVAKCYSTRSGEDPTFYNVFEENTFTQKKIFFDSEDYQNFDSIQKAGKEFGVTTGRKRAIRYFCIDRVVTSIQATGANLVVINKWDILEETNIFKMILSGTVVSFENSILMFNFIKQTIKLCCPEVRDVIYSASPLGDIDWEKYLL
jgi:adenylosuccinate synthase